jgi:putative transposase
MFFEENHLYHIYNRGNLSRKTFYSRENYLFFLKKIREYILPYTDIVAWCLMPSHFHLMVHVNQVVRPVRIIETLTPSESLNDSKIRSLNNSIGIMLRTYTRAIQKQEGLNGSLFQEHTKAICLTQCNGLSPAYFNQEYGTIINIPNPEEEYPLVCFNYIHQNPVSAGLCISPQDWEFCSGPDYYSDRKGKLVNKEMAKEFGLI